ncbi:MAG: hypothetical protein ACPGSD_02775 [Flavobacteriales bacterium]
MKYLALLSTSFFLFFGCNSTDDSSVSEQEIIGTWKYVESVQVGGLIDPASGMPITSTMIGNTKTIIINSDSTFNINIPAESYNENGILLIDSLSTKMMVNSSLVYFHDYFNQTSQDTLFLDKTIGALECFVIRKYDKFVKINN